MPEDLHPAGFPCRLADLGAALLPAVLTLCLALAWLASLAIPVRKYLLAGDFSWLPGAGLYLLLAGGLGWLVWRARQISEGRLVGILIGAATIVKLALAFSTLHLPLNTDQTLFRHFVCEMADQSLQGEALARLSATYDYPVWAGRAMPVHYLLRRLAGAHDLPWVRLVNVGFSLAILLVTYGLARRLLPAGRRKWAVFLVMVLPFQTFVVSDYSHHLFSSFYFLLGMWAATEMILTDPGPWRRSGLALLVGVCLLFMTWQRGIHLIAMGTWLVLVAWTAAACGWRQGGRLALGLVLIPAVLALPLARRFDRCLEAHDVHHLNSILPAFMARGWCPESGGEYCRRYEQLDEATPGPEKKSAMYRLVLSQIRRNPMVVCAKLPLIKTAKLFLVGYAANFEESLVAENAPALPWVRGMRLIAAPLFLGAALYGCFLLCFRPDAQRRWLPVLLAPVLTWGTYVFVGESSPRYSIFCQPFLGLLGAWALTRGADATGRPAALTAKTLGHFALRMLVCLAAALLALSAAAGIVQRLPADWFYADLKQGWSSPVPETIRPGALQPFEVQLCVPSGSAAAQADWQLPPRRDSMDKLSLYLLKTEKSLHAMRLGIDCSGIRMLTVSLADFQEPQQLKIALPRSAESLRFVIEPVSDTSMNPGCLEIGYASFFTDDKP